MIRAFMLYAIAGVLFAHSIVLDCTRPGTDGYTSRGYALLVLAWPVVMGSMVLDDKVYYKCESRYEKGQRS